MTIFKKEKKRVFKEFELIDLFPYTLAVLMVLGSFYLLHTFLDIISRFY